MLNFAFSIWISVLFSYFTYTNMPSILHSFLVAADSYRASNCDSQKIDTSWSPHVYLWMPHQDSKLFQRGNWSPQHVIAQEGHFEKLGFSVIYLLNLEYSIININIFSSFHSLLCASDSSSSWSDIHIVKTLNGYGPRNYHEGIWALTSSMNLALQSAWERREHGGNQCNVFGSTCLCTFLGDIVCLSSCTNRYLTHSP